MSKRNNRKRTFAPQRAATSDSFQNLMARTGIGASNLASGARYGFNPVTRNRVEMEFVYRGSWIAGMAVDCVAEDMTREGVEILSEIDPDTIESIEREASLLNVWESLAETIKWARLYGGAIGVMLIDGQDVSTPLRLDTIEKGQFKGILPLDRWMVMPSQTDLVTDYGPDFGNPKFYDVIKDARALMNMKVHHSRVIRLEGVSLPYWQKIAENGWGQSVLERLWDRLVAFDSATNGVAQLVYKAHLRTFKVKGLRDLIAMGGPALEGFVKQVEMMRAYQSNEGITIMDSEDEFDAHQFTFSGLPDTIEKFADQISGALGVPKTRLFGMAPGGLNATGEGDLRNYYDSIKQQQERRLKLGVMKVYDALHRSVTGDEPPEGFDVKFRSLWQMSDSDKASITTSVTDAVCKASDSGIIDRATALKELRQASQVTGIFTNVTEDQITEAEDEPPPSFGETNGEKPESGQDPESGAPVPRGAA